jgi:hypothetical protein
MSKKKSGCSVSGLIIPIAIVWWFWGSDIKIWVTGTDESSFKETVEALTENENLKSIAEGFSGLVSEIDSNIFSNDTATEQGTVIEEPIRTAEDILNDDEGNAYVVGE